MSVSTGELGDPVTFVCRFSDVEYSSTRVKWYKQSIGDTLTLITTLMETTTNPSFEEGFPSSRFAANYSSEESTLTILKTVPEDEALYHCSISTWKTDQWTGTFLSLKGNTSLFIVSRVGRTCFTTSTITIVISEISFGCIQCVLLFPLFHREQKNNSQLHCCPVASSVWSSSTRRLCDPPVFDRLQFSKVLVSEWPQRVLVCS